MRTVLWRMPQVSIEEMAIRECHTIKTVKRYIHSQKIMNNGILYILLPDYAAHEAVYLSQAIASDEYAMKEKPKYVNKVVAPSMEPVKSIGGYVHAQAVSDRNIITANGTASLEFARELLLLLENDTPEHIEMYYQFNKQGFCPLFPSN